MGDDVYVFDPEMVQQPDRVFVESTPALVINVKALAKSAVVKSDTCVVLGKIVHLPPPTQMVTTLTVGKQYGWAGAMKFVIELNSVDRCKRHAWILRLRPLLKLF